MEKEDTFDNNNEQEPVSPSLKQKKMKKKKNGPLNLIKIALFMLRHRSAGKSNSVHVGVATKSLWKRLLGAMRLLQLHHQSPLPPITIENNPTTVEAFQDVHPQPSSLPLPPKSTTLTPSSSTDSMSRYASAQNLQELDRSEQDEDGDDDNGDEMIDAKAEEFIARFYEQMRLQHLNSINS
ncbi:PREDICTED: uncharacterized protein LOC104598838 [Nelumbo nucifera]|uniref:Uncharacterized protein LOC104598838 n=2 Tax=Nelumbo nucifera TaxID=4432 RepID=A0A1U8ACD7_NELNU|nr:PREDICTED: uncharacterized protein LOC104598838 [Nelumbo nucifera]DAD38202.1 TPA_asm: hypothetical protein HUJ06_008843 [Nelumbo nucifera]